jgi:flagellin
MSFSDFSLKSSDRNIIFAMQKANEQAELSQTRINTGKKINSAADDPTKFSIANALITNAGDFAKLQDSMKQGIKTLEATIGGLNAIKSLLENMQGKIDTARATNDTTSRALASRSYSSLVTQITNQANDTSYNGKNLIKDTGTGNTYDFHIIFGIDTSSLSSYTIAAVGSTAASLGLDSSANSWAADADIDAAQSLLSAALTTIRSTIDTYGTHINMLKIRDDFTSNHINALQNGAAQLTEADKNEEAAKLNALKTQQLVAISGLGFSGQMDQGILRLLG